MKIQTINRLFSTRAAMMLLMMLLTTTTAWAGEYTVTYRANISHTGNSYSAILERNDDTSKKATIVTSGSGWSGGTGVRVDDEYDVTFTPSNNLSIATNPGTHTATGFIMSSGDFTASVALHHQSNSHRPLPLLHRGRRPKARSLMRDSVRWRKQARIILMLAQELNITEEEALDRFYNSRTYPFFADPARGLQAMSDRYIVDEILQE